MSLQRNIAAEYDFFNGLLGMSVSYLLYEGDKKSGFLFTFQDLTEIRRLEREVRLKENLATMGEMAAGMAHEIRNPLASISGSVQVLREVETLSDEEKRLMDIIVRESERTLGDLDRVSGLCATAAIRTGSDRSAPRARGNGNASRA